ncbi:formate--tetrahydrofolate ligase [Brevundimonas sp. AJA228-03]|uniref:formate--tetrahydrofolate ligase n=1 Tax=Brevundimonas sp. AJA228-03 TaxID=2752515 RepID=UPI001AE00A9A|nr:formate--tetrahydrofolate ligase [Brevundimonas sp. AJA228-03]QTN18946.1 formate--tetrahydrofolate ligase [Brevundimonas sp. AJA228-03]
MPGDIEISQAATLEPIQQIAARVGIGPDALEPYGRYIAKLSREALARLADRPAGRLILVTAINPTAAGEGKTTTTIGLGDALNRIGRKTVIALREPSLGPVFGRKGGATGGGHAQVAPMERINLHFTGDFHAIGAAHNLLAAMVDNALYWGDDRGLDARRVTWRRVVDMNDRALRQVAVGLGGTNGAVRESGFDITVASEVMAVLCLAEGPDDLAARLARIVVGRTRDGGAVTAGDIGAAGAMAALLGEAVLPNLVQSLGGTPTLVHGGPFANIAHGCNSVTATRAALALGEFAVTEAGFGADLGAEKFLNIKCRSSGLAPAAAVIVATVRALKLQGGVAKDALGTGDVAAVRAGFVNLARHIENLHGFGLPVVVAINAFHGDTAEEQAAIIDLCAAHGVEAHVCTHWADGGAGAVGLAHAVAALADANDDPGRALKLTYADDLPLEQKIRTVAQSLYRAADIALSAAARKDLARFEAEGHGHLPVCMAKTPYSFTADEKVSGAPQGFVLPVESVRLSAGAGFVVALCGAVNTMPGLPRVPSAERIGLGADGRITGLD